ncbi:hypothetical protein [Nocardia yunnanensis]|uniref:hypothetical protein n=1 Tax=Nocardia yunnanensis TaxID=2382165 RepID=UPI0013C4F050|nr:hypothetical protein [Nocardia yunnanensis]
MRFFASVLLIAATLGCVGCSTDEKPRSAQSTTTTAPQPDPIKDAYFRVQAYVKQHPETAHFFDPIPGNAYQGPNLLQSWNLMCEGTGAAINAWRDDYARFAWAVNHELGREEFAPEPKDDGIIVEGPQC